MTGRGIVNSVTSVGVGSFRVSEEKFATCGRGGDTPRLADMFGDVESMWQAGRRAEVLGLYCQILAITR